MGSCAKAAEVYAAGGEGLGDQATKIALSEFPARSPSVTIERKHGKNVYVVEIQTPKDGEKDVFVDIESGKIVGTD